MNPHDPHEAADAALLEPTDPHTDDEAIDDPRQRRFILITMCLALGAVIASVSGLNVAQQALAADLGASQSQLLWIINGYTLALAALLMPIAAIGDPWGAQTVLIMSGDFKRSQGSGGFAQRSEHRPLRSDIGFGNRRPSRLPAAS